MAKRIRISPDGGTTYYTFPGSKGEIQREGADIDDTILGQSFKSGQTGLIGWSISTNGVYKGFAGYKAVLKKSGSPTSFTSEAMTLVSGKTYKITDATKNCWNRLVTPAFTDGGGAINATNVESIDYLFGQVTFISSFTPTGSVTVDGSYLPLTQIAKGQSFTLNQTSNPIDNTDFNTAQGNDGYRTFESGLRTVSLALKGVYASSNAFAALLEARAELIIEIDPVGDGKSVCRGWFKALGQGQSGEVGELEEESLNFALSVPAQDDVVLPFKWLHAADSTLSLAIQTALNAWESDTLRNVVYLPDGTNGVEGTAIVVDMSLAGGLEVMNDFTVKLQGSDALAAYP